MVIQYRKFLQNLHAKTRWKAKPHLATRDNRTDIMAIGLYGRFRERFRK